MAKRSFFSLRGVVGRENFSSGPAFVASFTKVTDGQGNYGEIKRARLRLLSWFFSWCY